MNLLQSLPMSAPTETEFDHSRKNRLSVDRPPRRIRSAVAVVLGFLLSVGIALGGAAAPAQAYDEDVIVSLANEARAANGLGGLVRNPSLDAVALDWAYQMAASGTLSHNPSVGEQIPGGWTRWGENVAQGFGSGASVHEGWMNSDGHRANILGDFTDIGTALIEGGGTTWAVQVFANYPGSGLPVQAPPPAASEPPAEDGPPAEPAPSAPAPGDSPPAAAPPADGTAPDSPAKPTTPGTPTESPQVDDDAAVPDEAATADDAGAQESASAAASFPWGGVSLASSAAMLGLWVLLRRFLR